MEEVKAQDNEAQEKIVAKNQTPVEEETSATS